MSSPITALTLNAEPNYIGTDTTVSVPREHKYLIGRAVDLLIVRQSTHD